MNSTAVRPVFETTSAAGAMLRQVREPVLASVIFVGLGTSAAGMPPPKEISYLQRSVDQTNAGTVLPSAASAGGAAGSHAARRGCLARRMPPDFHHGLPGHLSSEQVQAAARVSLGRRVSRVRICAQIGHAKDFRRVCPPTYQIAIMSMMPPPLGSLSRDV